MFNTNHIELSYGVKVIKRSIQVIIFIIALGSLSIAMADSDFNIWKKTFRDYALAKGVLAQVFDKSMTNITLDSEVLELDNSQPEFTRNIWDYINNATSVARIKKGKALLEEHRILFDHIEKYYGVEREIITAIWAMESDFGRNYGNKSVLSSLATLAYGSASDKRSSFALNELLLTLKIIQTKKVSSELLIGSWAGAMGQPQFIPSSYLNYGVDYDQNGQIDLWQSIPDVLASIANFLSEAGWRENEMWGEEVSLPAKFDWRLNSSSYFLRYQQWYELNVTKISGGRFPYPQRQASLFIPAGKNGPKFLITHNFSVIKRYNKSSSYALGVAQLSNLFGLGDAIKGSWPIADKALTIEQLKEIQTLLNLYGHDAGKVDGKIGSITREAIRTWQLENGFSGDGYANLNLLRQLRANARLKTNDLIL